jgi:LytR cell envelope-related transcriptional attenuator
VTSAVRAVILIVAVVIGIVVIRNAFPQNASQTITTPRPSAGTTTGPTSTPTPSPTGSPTRKPRVKGVTVQVLNGTSTTGLAGIVTIQLKKDGWSMQDPGNVQSASRTSIYYRDGFRPQALLLQQQHFPKAVVSAVPSPLPSGFSSSVDVTVVLGPDFSPSPS